MRDSNDKEIRMKDIEPDILGRFLSGEQTSDDLKAVNGWLKASKENREELFGMERLGDDIMADDMSDERIADAERKLFALIGGQQPARQSRRWLRYAASFVGIIIIFAAGWAGVSVWQRHAEAMEMLTAQAPKTKNICVSLSDGTRVWLRKGSSLRYPKSFEDKESREVQLDGEGYFEVSHDSSHPFMVNGGKLDVTVLGTTFNMRSGKASSDAEVSLVKGIVRATATGDGGSIVLKPGQKASIDQKTGFLQVSEVDAYADGLWHEHKTPFRNASINAIAKQIEGTLGVKVIVHGGFDMTRRYNGVIDERGSVDSVLMLLQNALPINYKVKGGVVHLYPHY